MRLQSMLVLESLAAEETGKLRFLAAYPLVRVDGRLSRVSAAALPAGEHFLN